MLEVLNLGLYKSKAPPFVMVVEGLSIELLVLLFYLSLELFYYFSLELLDGLAMHPSG
jgi:hypothetical protein